MKIGVLYHEVNRGDFKKGDKVYGRENLGPGQKTCRGDGSSSSKPISAAVAKRLDRQDR